MSCPGKPTLYYSEPGVEVHCGRVEQVLDTIDPKSVALLSADPPYGVNEQTKRKSKGRGVNPKKWATGTAKDHAAVEGDDRPFDPAQLLTFPRVAMWGANHYANRLPSSPSWILWDKRAGVTPDDNADGEMAWTNLGGPLRIFRHLWRGLCRASEAGEQVKHPTQKPIALYAWLFSWRTKPGDLIVAPYAGSGPDVAAARMLGRRIIAIECVESYCAEIVKRLRQPLLPMAQPVERAPAPTTGDLFGGRS